MHERNIQFEKLRISTYPDVPSGMHNVLSEQLQEIERTQRTEIFPRSMLPIDKLNNFLWRYNRRESRVRKDMTTVELPIEMIPGVPLVILQAEKIAKDHENFKKMREVAGA